MQKSILNFEGLYGENLQANGQLTLPDFVHCEPIETRSKKHDWVIKQHIHTNLIQIFCFEVGSGKLLIDKSETALKTPCLLVIPENTMHGFEFDSEINGTVLTFSVAFLEKLFKNSPKIAFDLSYLRVIFPNENTSTFNNILYFIEKIREELFENLPEKELMLQALFTTFLTFIFRLSQGQNEHFFRSNKRSLGIFKAFSNNIKTAKKPQKTILNYAQELKISPIHLNRICQTVAQKSALQVVNDYFIAEAKKYLRHTSFGVSEVAYQLNFEDPAYFSRLFKKHSGQSPKAFREAILVEI